MRAVYDYAFGYADGICDRAHRAIGAGTYLCGTLRLVLTYREAIFLKMNGGMGDTMFTPYYKALTARGVKFRFFHDVRALRLDGQARGVERIELDRQATPTGSYDPFVRVRGLDCWPSEPLWDQLEEREDLLQERPNLESAWSGWRGRDVTLQRGVDFDEVVLGIPIGAFPDIAADLIEASPMWHRMVHRVKTVGTQAMQIWHRPQEIGWPHGNTILTAFADNMNTWADMTHLAAHEDWPDSDRPGRISYFCGPTPDPDHMPDGPAPGFPATLARGVQSAARTWIGNNGAHLFPSVMEGRRLDPAQLVAAGDDPDAWQAQYFRKNIEPSERYVMSVPGSSAARLRADRSGFDNLWLAGDWTWTAINAGCVEAATMAGMRAAAGIAGRVPQIIGEDPDPVVKAASVGTVPAPASHRAQNAAWPWSAAYGLAQTTAAVAVMAFPHATVAAMLPEGLEPAAQTLTDAQAHPVILMLGRQRDVRPNIAPFGMNYLEFICAVPWVRHTDPKLAALQPLIHPTRLYLDRVPPILLGIYGYGFPKKRARIQADRESYVIRGHHDDRTILSAMFTSAGPETWAYHQPHFTQTRAAFDMTMVTRNRLGQWQYSVYDFSLGQARLTPIDLSLRLRSAALGLPPGNYAPPSLADTALGAFLLRTRATISNPLQSFDLRRKLAKGDT